MKKLLLLSLIPLFLMGCSKDETSTTKEIYFTFNPNVTPRPTLYTDMYYMVGVTKHTIHDSLKIVINQPDERITINVPSEATLFHYNFYGSNTSTPITINGYLQGNSFTSQPLILNQNSNKDGYLNL